MPETSPDLRSVLKSQYHAALAMLREAIERCPDETWTSTAHRNAFWQVAYHTLFFAHAYLMPERDAFRPWREHQSDVQHPDGIPGEIDEASPLPPIPEPYTRAQALEYWGICDRLVDEALDTLDLTRADSGFPRYKISKLEHQLVNIRHIQHHTAQLADRLRDVSDIGIRWVGYR